MTDKETEAIIWSMLWSTKVNSWEEGYLCGFLGYSRGGSVNLATPGHSEGEYDRFTKRFCNGK